MSTFTIDVLTEYRETETLFGLRYCLENVYDDIVKKRLSGEFK